MTFVETVPLHGQGGQGDLILADAKGNHLNKVELQYSNENLAGCLEDRSPLALFYTLLQYLNLLSYFDETWQPNIYKDSKDAPFTLKQTLSLRNLGRLPVFITSVAAYGSSPGLRLSEISGNNKHVIPTNGTINFQMIYTPDFQSPKTFWYLTVNSSVGSVRYPVVALIPPKMLPMCKAALPRPEWELNLLISVIAIVIPNIIGAMLFALSDAYYITAVVRNLKSHIAKAQQKQDEQNVNHRQNKTNQTSNKGAQVKNRQQNKVSSKNQNGDRKKHENVIGTIVSEPKVWGPSRFWQQFTLRLTNSFKPANTMRRQSSDLQKQVLDSSEVVAEEKKLKDQQDLKQQKHEESLRRSKNRSKRQPRSGFRRLYGQLVPSDLQHQLDTDASSVKGDLAKSCSTSAEDVSVLSRKSSSVNSAKHPDSQEQEDGQELNRFLEADGSLEGNETNYDDSQAQEGNVKNDGQSADDECSSNDEVALENSSLKRKKSSIPSVFLSSAVQSEEECGGNEVDTKHSTTSTSSFEGIASGTGSESLPTWFDSKPGLSLGDMEIEKKLRHTNNNNTDWASTRKPTHTGHSHGHRHTTDTPPRLQKRNYLPVGVAKAHVAPQVSHVPPRQRSDNGPHVASENKRGTGSHFPVKPQPFQTKPLQNIPPQFNHHQQAPQLPVGKPSVLTSLRNGGSLSNAPPPMINATATDRRTDSWLGSLSTPQPFSSKSPPFIPSNGGQLTNIDSRQMPTSNFNSSTNSNFGIPVGLAERVIDEQDFNSWVELTKPNLNGPANLGETQSTSSTWSWGDSIWNPMSSTMSQRAQTQTTNGNSQGQAWDPWAATVVNALWGDGGDSNVINSLNKNNSEKQGEDKLG